MRVFSRREIDFHLEGILLEERYDKSFNFFNDQDLPKFLWVTDLVRKLNSDDDYKYFNLLATGLDYDYIFMQELSRAVRLDGERDKAVTAYKIIFEHANQEDYHKIGKHLMINLSRNKRTYLATREIFSEVEPTEDLVRLFLTQQYFAKGSRGPQKSRKAMAKRAGDLIVEVFGQNAIKYMPRLDLELDFDEENAKYIDWLKNKSRDGWKKQYGEEVVPHYIERVSAIKERLELL